MSSITAHVELPKPAAPAEKRRPPQDVWAWTAPKYRLRAALLLGLNFCLFSGLCVFAYWLRTGSPLDFSWASYFEPLRFWGPETHNLYDFVLYPVSVETNPIHGVVIGLLLASMTAIPIAVSQLYRFPAGALFCASVLVFAHMPWFAATLLLSCVLASVRPFRLRFRFGAALVGMLPVLLYLLLATRGPNDLLSASISPERKLLLASPWILAILAACVMLGLTVFLAQAVGYRPGAVAPTMAVMFVAPAALFQTFVGFDELAYRSIELEYGPRAPRFEPVQEITARVLEFVRQRLTGPIAPAAREVLLKAAGGAAEPAVEALATRFGNRLLVELLADRHAGHVACRSFLDTHLTSRYVANVLYIQARVLDTRLDELRVVDQQAQRELYTDFPHVQSEPVWTALLTQHADSPLAIAARLRVAQLRLRRGDAAGALAALDLVLPYAPRFGPSVSPRRTFVEAGPPEASLEFEPDEFEFEAARLRELIVSNGGSDRSAEDREALQALASLDPHRRGYRDQLAALGRRYANRPLHDNVVVRWALAHVDRRVRAALLRDALELFPDGDAYPEALFRLAEIELQAPGAGDQQRIRGAARLRELLARFAHTCWGRLAAERLELLLPPTTRAAEGART